MTNSKGDELSANGSERAQRQLTAKASDADSIIIPTQREQELIGHIAHGLSNKLIAYEMKISPNTVRAHIGNIMRKYKLHNRTQIAMLLLPMLRDVAPSAIRHP